MSQLLAKLGAAAFRPTLVRGVWHKPAISAKNQARLRKEALLTKGTWEFEPAAKEHVWERPPKGHQFEREKRQRLKQIEENLKTMDERIAKHRAERRKINATLLDRLLSTPSQLRKKAKSG